MKPLMLMIAADYFDERAVLGLREIGKEQVGDRCLRP